MGLNWSHRKCKNDTLIVCKAPLGKENEDFWLLWNNVKTIKALKDEWYNDGFSSPKKETFRGHQWFAVWFHTITPESYEMVDDSGDEMFRWKYDLEQLIDKWSLRLAGIKDALMDGGSQDESVEDPYDEASFDIADENSE